MLIGGDTGEVGAGSGHRPSTACALGFGGVGVERWVVRLVVAFKASCWVLREQARVGLFLVPGPVGVTASWLGVCRRGWVGWSLFENCTVDASIFATCTLWGVCCFDDRLFWSSCRGRMVDALAPGADEGRGRPR